MLKINESELLLDDFFPKGFVIELCNGLYYAGRTDRRIRATGLHGAKSFQTVAEAQECIEEHMQYVHLHLYICQICFVLVNDGDLDVMYWDGQQLQQDAHQAIVFQNYEEVAEYRNKHGLDQLCVIDIMAHREKEMKIAA